MLQARAADGRGPSGYGSHPELQSHSLRPGGDPVMDALMAEWAQAIADAVGSRPDKSPAFFELTQNDRFLYLGARHKRDVRGETLDEAE